MALTRAPPTTPAPRLRPRRSRGRTGDRRARRRSRAGLMALWLLGCWLGLAAGECPGVCECKWKNGKESVLCLHANLTQIPTPLDAGTQVLDLSGNEIATVPHDAFAAANLLNLQKVFLARCRLRVIERFAFRKLSNLVELDLSYNQLGGVPSQALEAVPELRELRLNGNPILRLPDAAFAHVPQLVRLELTDCRLAAVEARAFAGLEGSLEWLKLDGNRLSEVRAGTITSLASLHGLELARNQWNCSCGLRPLRAWMLRENIPCGVPPLCRAPARLAGKTWDKIDLDEFACVPQIVATDTTAHGVEGRNVTMSCFVEGVPEPSVRWMVKNRVIANLTAPGEAGPRAAAATTQGRKTYVVNMLRNASNLTILTADMQDAGIYTCAAENKAGKVEASVTLAVSRRPPDAPLGAKIVLLCVLIALLFVVGSSFAAVCLCSLRRRRKMGGGLWNTVPPARTESYEKIEMTTRACAGDKPDLGGGANGAAGNGGRGLCDEDNGYLRSATTPLCGSDEGIAVVNPSGAHAPGSKRNGDYRNVPTTCDDEGPAYEDQSDQGGGCASFAATTRWKGATLRTSPQEPKRKGAAATTTLEDTDLHIPRLIDIGSNPDSASSSISSQVDAAARLGGYAHIPAWTGQIATTKITSPHSQPATKAPEGPYYGTGDDVSTSVFCSSEADDRDLFDSNYPDLLDIAKYAVASNAAGGGVCTLPRKLKNTGKYFKNSSDSQSPLLADTSSKYGSSTLGDAGFLNEAAGFGRRFSAESSYSNYAGGGVYTSGQRANSFLNLVQSCNNKGALAGLAAAAGPAVGAATSATAQRRNPSLPSSPVHEPHQHQRSFSSAATPLLDFSSLTTRSGGALSPAVAGSSGTTPTTHPAVTTVTAAAASASPATAYDYHAAQLERFLEEYRNLQDQLCKMKETCETIRKKDAPMRGALGHSAQLADPVMFNAAMATGPHPKPTTLKTKAILPGQPPDPPPYWLHRNAMLKRLNDSQTDIFKS